MEAPATEPLVVGRYALFDVIASGGMATVHLGRLLGPVGFSRTVAIKRLHVGFARDPEFVSMFLDEARLAARIRHPNVVQTVDVVATKGELFLVMDYVQGESLARLLRLLAGLEKTMPIRIAVSILSGMLQGLHAAHIAKDEHGLELGIVHRDVSPQNVLVGVDGMARVLDFGIAKAAGRMQTTRDGQVKGKLAYMAPEQVHQEVLTRTADVYAASIVAWEVLTGRRLFKADNEATVLAKVLAGTVSAPSSLAPDVPAALDEVIMRGLARDPISRFQTAKEMSSALERASPAASLAEVAEWLDQIAGPTLAARATLVAKVETDSGVSSVESLKRRMLAELGDEGPPVEDAFTSTRLGVGVPKDPVPVVRSTARLESAAQQAMARIAAEEQAKAGPISVALAAPRVDFPRDDVPPAAPVRSQVPSQTQHVPAVAITQRNDPPRNVARAAGIAVVLLAVAGAGAAALVIAIKRGAGNHGTVVAATTSVSGISASVDQRPSFDPGAPSSTSSAASAANGSDPPVASATTAQAPTGDVVAAGSVTEAAASPASSASSSRPHAARGGSRATAPRPSANPAATGAIDPFDLGGRR